MRPAKAHFRAGTAVGRSKDAFAEHESESIEKHTVFVGFLGRTDWGGAGAGGWGLTDRVIAVGLEFPAPCGCGPWAAGCGAAANEVNEGKRPTASSLG